MTAVCILGGILLIALIAKRITKMASEPFPLDSYHPHPECFVCDDEACAGCPLIEAKEGKN